jgi:hypothetical protein
MSDFPERGYLRNYSLPRMLIFLNRHRVTGTVSITSQGTKKAIYLKKGNAVFASSTYEDDRLGEMLVKAGKITVAQYDRAVTEMLESGKRLGSVLVEQGTLSPQDLFWGVKFQVQEIIYSLFQLRDGVYEFSEGNVPAELITLDLSMAKIIYEGVKRIEDWTRIKAEMPPADTVFVYSPDPLSLFQKVSLSDEGQRILSLVDGRRTISDIVEAAGINNFEALKTLYVLCSIGMVTDSSHNEPVAFTVEDILKPLDDERDEFVERVTSIHAALGSLSHHQLLSLEEDAGLDDLNRQYYNLSKEFHPDRHGSSVDETIREKTNDIFQAITRSYQVLKEQMSGQARGMSPGRAQPARGQNGLTREMLRDGKERIKQGRFGDAADCLKVAVEAAPDCVDCWTHYALALSRLAGRLPEAARAMLAAQELEPDNAGHYANLGLIYLRGKKLREAQEQFERALALDPSNQKAQKGLSQIPGRVP